MGGDACVTLGVASDRPAHKMGRGRRKRPHSTSTPTPPLQDAATSVIAFISQKSWRFLPLISDYLSAPKKRFRFLMLTHILVEICQIVQSDCCVRMFGT